MWWVWEGRVQTDFSSPFVHELLVCPEYLWFLVYPWNAVTSFECVSGPRVTCWLFLVLSEHQTLTFGPFCVAYRFIGSHVQQSAPILTLCSLSFTFIFPLIAFGLLVFLPAVWFFPSGLNLAFHWFCFLWYWFWAPVLAMWLSLLLQFSFLFFPSVSFLSSASFFSHCVFLFDSFFSLLGKLNSVFVDSEMTLFPECVFLCFASFIPFVLFCFFLVAEVSWWLFSAYLLVFAWDHFYLPRRVWLNPPWLLLFQVRSIWSPAPLNCKAGYWQNVMAEALFVFRSAIWTRGKEEWSKASLECLPWTLLNPSPWGGGCWVPVGERIALEFPHVH